MNLLAVSEHIQFGAEPFFFFKRHLNNRGSYSGDKQVINNEAERLFGWFWLDIDIEYILVWYLTENKYQITLDFITSPI